MGKMSEEMSAFAAYKSVEKKRIVEEPKKKKNRNRKNRNKEKLLQTFDDNTLTKEHKMLKKMVHPSSINHGDKKKFKSSKKRKRSAIVETSMAGDRSSSDSDPDSKLKKFKNNEEEESTLNGDDVPLVEEMVEDLLDEDSVESPKIAVNADNFMHTVMQMNKAQSDDDEFATKLREDFGLKSKKKTSQNNKKLKIDNGLN